MLRGSYEETAPVEFSLYGALIKSVNVNPFSQLVVASV